MSHRITTKTEIKDKDIAIKACQASGSVFHHFMVSGCPLASGSSARLALKVPISCLSAV